ncbi:hypothetical protein ALO84_101495 [Pseudomonas syringae pv. maculicola]|nr:Unknown protein sequence [Pseudomonas syringae pv. maculicola str. M6]KPX74194.1 hypothetical protein ALO84_101495 [Pseudomonas syringae pv. maculicola]
MIACHWALLGYLYRSFRHAAADEHPKGRPTLLPMNGFGGFSMRLMHVCASLVESVQIKS